MFQHPEWRFVRFGLSVMVVALIATLVGVVALLGASLVRIGLETMAAERTAESLRETFVVAQTVLAGIVLSAMLIALIGRGICCAAPPGRFRRLAAGSAVLQFLGVLLATGLSVLLWMLSGRAAAVSLPFVLGYAPAGVAFAIGHVLFETFLQNIIRLRRDKALELNLHGYCVAFCCFALVVGLAPLSSWLEHGRIKVDYVVSLLVPLLLMLGWYVYLLQKAREVIDGKGNESVG